MVTRRQRRISSLIKEAISEVLQQDVADPRLDFVTITDVETSSNLRQAYIYVSALGDSANQEQALKALRSATGFLRRELGQKVYLRHVPDLEFRLDRSIERGQRIDRILWELQDSQQQSEE